MSSKMKIDPGFVKSRIETFEKKQKDKAKTTNNQKRNQITDDVTGPLYSKPIGENNPPAKPKRENNPPAKPKRENNPPTKPNFGIPSSFLNEGSRYEEHIYEVIDENQPRLYEYSDAKSVSNRILQVYHKSEPKIKPLINNDWIGPILDLAITKQKEANCVAALNQLFPNKKKALKIFQNDSKKELKIILEAFKTSEFRDCNKEIAHELAPLLIPKKKNLSSDHYKYLCKDGKSADEAYKIVIESVEKFLDVLLRTDLNDIKCD